MLSYQEGSVFAIPLRRGGHAVGVVARTSPKGRILLAYIFGPARNVVPALSEVENLRPQDALRVARIGDLSLIDETWVIIGQIQNWKRMDWPMPPFVRRDDITKKAWRVQYSDMDANCVASEMKMSYQQAGEFERDAVLGAGAVEIIMTKLLYQGEP